MELSLIYALMVLIPALLLVIMLMAGGGGDVDADTDLNVDLDHEVELGDTGGPGPLGIKLILAFIIGFGLGGFLGVYYEWIFPHLLSGLIGGAVIYTVVYLLLKALYRQQANTQISAASLAGSRGVVTLRIAKGAVGEIRALDPGTGHNLHLRARAASPEQEFAPGEEVLIKSVGMGLAQVDRPSRASGSSDAQ